MPTPRLVSLPQLADQIGVSRGALRKRMAEGRSDGHFIGGIWLFTPDQAAKIRAEVKPQRKRKAHFDPTEGIDTADIPDPVVGWEA